MSIFVSGTKTIFQQTSAPTGWTKDTVNYNNHCLRLVSGTASSGGSVDFTSVFTPTTFSVPVSMPVLGATTLTALQLPLHQHSVNNPGVRMVNPTPATPTLILSTAPSPGSLVTATTSSLTSGAANPAFSSGAHDHPFSVTLGGDCGNLDVKYVDVIICTKN